MPVLLDLSPAHTELLLRLRRVESYSLSYATSDRRKAVIDIVVLHPRTCDLSSMRLCMQSPQQAITKIGSGSLRPLSSQSSVGTSTTLPKRPCLAAIQVSLHDSAQIQDDATNPECSTNDLCEMYELLDITGHEAINLQRPQP